MSRRLIDIAVECAGGGGAVVSSAHTLGVCSTGREAVVEALTSSLGEENSVSLAIIGGIVLDEESDSVNSRDGDARGYAGRGGRNCSGNDARA